MLSNLQRSINGRRRIYLARHGNVRYFDENGRPYHQKSMSLDEEGVAQSQALERALRPAAIDRLVTSGLLRTVQTAGIIAENRAVEPEVREDLREIAAGRLEDLPAADTERAFTGALSGRIQRDRRFLGGESFGSLEDRVLRCFRSLLEDRKWENLLIVAHGGTNRVLLAHALGAGLEVISRIEQEPACLNVIDVDADGSFIVRLLNYTPYSPVKDGIRMTTMERIYAAYVAGAGSASSTEAASGPR